MLDMKNISFIDHCELDGRLEIYFSGPKDILPEGKYKDALDTTIKVYFESSVSHYPENAKVEYSPTKYDEDEDSYIDYDWND